MDLLLKLILLVSSMRFMTSACQINGGNTDKTPLFSSTSVNYLLEKNALIKYIESLNRFENTLGFICACALIREANSEKYKQASYNQRGTICTNTWKRFVEMSQDPAAIKLRGSVSTPALLLPHEYDIFSSSLCASYFVCSKHIYCDKKTVQILNQVKAGSTKTVIEMFQDECEQFLLTAENMKYINIFLQAVGEKPFPFFKFNKLGVEYAIPKIRNDTDQLTCPSFIRRPGSGT